MESVSEKDGAKSENMSSDGGEDVIEEEVSLRLRTRGIILLRWLLW